MTNAITFLGEQITLQMGKPDTVVARVNVKNCGSGIVEVAENKVCGHNTPECLKRLFALLGSHESVASGEEVVQW